MNLFRLFNKRSLAQASFVIQIGSVTLCALFWALGSYYLSYHELEKQIGFRVQKITEMTAALIPGETHEQIVQSYLNQDPELTSRPFFKQVQKTLSDVQKLNQIENDIYTFIRPEWASNTLIYMAMSHPKTYVGNGLTASPTAILSLEKGIPTHSHFYLKNDQTWISAIAPIKTSFGKIVGAVEINYRATSELAHLQQTLLFSIAALTLLSFLITGIIGIKTGKWLRADIDPILEALQKASEGNLDCVIHTPLKNEIGQVYVNFNSLIQKIKQNQDELNHDARNHQNKTEQAILDKNQLEIVIQSLMGELPLGVILLQSNGRVWKDFCSPQFEALVGISSTSPPEYLADILQIPHTPHSSWLDSFHKCPKTWINDRGQMISFHPTILRDEALGLEIAMILASPGDPTFAQTQALSLEGSQEKRNLKVFLESSQRRLSFLETQPKVQAFYRSIRFLKEGTEEFSLSPIKPLLTAFELTTSELENNSSTDQDSIFSKLNSDIAALKEMIQELLSQSQDLDSIFEIPQTKILAFTQSLADFPALQQDFLKQFSLEPIEKFFRPLESKYMTLAKNLGKELDPFKIKGGNLLIDPSHYALLFRTLRHSFQNSIEHGIENPSDRVSLGKKTEGCISLYFAKQKTENGTFLKIAIQDDGRGIDAQRVRSSLLLHTDFNGMGSENDQQILQHLFQDGYSQFHYQENSTGRGFGLGFILEEAQRLGGTAELHSKPGSGTLLSVTVPEKLPPNMES